MSEERHSEADAALLIKSATERAAREAENAVRQFDRVLDLIDEVVRGGRPFRLRISVIQDLHRVALNGLSAYAGNWRPGDVRILHSRHQPPKAFRVAGLMEEMCDWINDRFKDTSPIVLCAYAMWRLNWIHPFDDGNGRTSRAVAYFVLCAAVGYRLPGRITLPELIAANKAPYYRALEQIDDSVDRDDKPDLTPMKELLEGYLAKQLAEAFEAANETRSADKAAQENRKFH